VIGVECVPQAEGVGERAEAGERRIVARVVDEEAPAGQVERRNGGAESAESAELAAREPVVANRSQEYKGYTKLVRSAG
jgi:hypothetical protein